MALCYPLRRQCRLKSDLFCYDENGLVAVTFLSKEYIRTLCCTCCLQNQFDISSMLPSQWSMYAPNPPSPEEVDCEIELEVVSLSRIFASLQNSFLFCFFFARGHTAIRHAYLYMLTIFAK